jgi:hypothetical protein
MAQKSKAKSKTGKKGSQSKLVKFLADRSRRFYVVALVFVVAFAALGAYQQWGRTSAGTDNLNSVECRIRGREYGEMNNYCASVCQPGAGAWIKHEGEFGYCGAAISETIGRDKCNSLGRNYVGVVGCARRWQQTRIDGAIQCQKATDTYFISSTYDYCDDHAGGGWTWPLPATHRVTTRWGESTSKGLHKGIDIGDSGGNLGAHVVAAHSGTVTQSYDSGACGYFMVIKAENTPYWQGYQHLEVGSAQVSRGEYVHAGEYIARVGRAGGSTCGTTGFFHLHFSVEKGNWISFYSSPLSNSINPFNVLP